MPLSTFKIVPDRIVAIAPAGREDVFDIQVEGTENFVANGVISHNTRWHEDDLSGWLLGAERGDDEPEGWTVVHLAATAEDEPPAYPPSCTVLPDWRDAGEALCPERFNEAALRRRERALGPYFWAALYQQRPTAREGGLFKAGRVGFVDIVPAGATWVRRWDIASSAGKGDYTAGVLMARIGPRYYVADLVMGQWGSDQRDAIIRTTAETDKSTYGRVLTVVPQDPAAAGKDMALALIRLLAGFPVESALESGSKELRADPFSSQWNAGDGKETWTVALVRAGWNARYLEIMTGFPNVKIKDPVDASSGAFNKLAAYRPAPVASPGGDTKASAAHEGAGATLASWLKPAR